MGGEVDPEREPLSADGALVRLLTRMQLAVKPGMEHMFELRYTGLRLIFLKLNVKTQISPSLLSFVTLYGKLIFKGNFKDNSPSDCVPKSLFKS